jgi:hypothetical protein
LIIKKQVERSLTAQRLLTTLRAPAYRKALGKPMYSSLMLVKSIKPVSQAERVTRRHWLRFRAKISPRVRGSSSAKSSADFRGDSKLNVP